LVSLGLAVLVAYQIIRGSGDWGQGILWGLIFGVSIFLVYFGMNAFHKMMNKDKDQDSDKEK
jgi:predicted cobalt transporter CbtA